MTQLWFLTLSPHTPIPYLISHQVLWFLCHASQIFFLSLFQCHHLNLGPMALFLEYCRSPSVMLPLLPTHLTFIYMKPRIWRHLDLYSNPVICCHSAVISKFCDLGQVTLAPWTLNFTISKIWLILLKESLHVNYYTVF